MTDARDTRGAAPLAGLAKVYRPHEVEPAIYERWLAADIFAPDGRGSRADPSRPPFVIIMPPPNVTGSLHLGHALTLALEDLMVRHARMSGRPTLWLPGLDHASIAAQVVLDRILAAEGESRASLGRERYLERMWRFVDETRATILAQMRRIGASADWGRLRFTMDEVSARAVRESFVRLYRRGLVYRAEALVNWCPGCRTSLSDLEVVAHPETGTLWTVRYHLVGEDGSPRADETIAVATTRPETIVGDTGVAVHPDDRRYAHLVGRRALVPVVNRVVPIVADSAVDPAFGTGAVKVTPAHDPVDAEIARRHGLPFLDVMNDDGTMNERAGPLAGLDRHEARRAILARLDAAGDLVGSTRHEMVIGRCQRSDDVVEPRLKTQWFVRTRTLADRALEATRSGRTRIVPARFEKVWEHWLTEIRDWNISRQLWWGHRIPAWYCPDGHVTVSAAPEGPGACEVCGRPAAELVQDPDIFDTWYSSGLWPFSTLGWPEETADLARFYPGSVMETGYDIIFFWVARMMMLGLELVGDVPFRVVYLHGLVRDPYGQKMSKTKGNVVDPLEVMEETGADALRFALVHRTSPGNDQRFGRAKLEEARNFANKLWNAARFVLGARPASIPPDGPRLDPDEGFLGPAERWIRSRVAATVAAVDRALASYAFGEVTRLLYDGIWGDFCDAYLEMAKVRLADEGSPAAEREATWWTLVEALDTYLRLLHPVMPFVTEAIWERLPRRPDDPDLLAVARWPVPGRRDKESERTVGALLELVRAIRNARSQAHLEPSLWLPVDVHVPPEVAPALAALQPAVERLARARPLRSWPSVEALHQAAPRDALTAVAAGCEALVTPVGAEAIAPRERERLERELAELEARLARTRDLLAQTSFLERAPAEVVAATRRREEELAEQAGRIRRRLEGSS
jgi:valyl-tRNA synthetase